ncbi:hypothetical protein HPP92_001234 [Vanilla planifolia]|uniref:Uncharacterized protein n=1 Tax=Vanilla planifolia TaxID=51239 RepID=A0A835RTL8_VANPL|nr:hypothetical protein HPP92_001234 [Vanilla planifolia]
MSIVAMEKSVMRTLLRLFPSSRRLSGATVLEGSVTTTKTVAAPEFKPLYRRLSALLMEWMNGSGGIKLSSSSHAVHLDLITKFKGIDEAEKYLTISRSSTKTTKLMVLF